MATLTANISDISLAVRATTQKTATISWTLPTVPDGMTITSCTLTGTATASMSKGAATITVNGQTVSSGSNFTINLGTENTTSSVVASVRGGNKNASGTVTISNLVYTVAYTEPIPTYIVTFVDHDGTVLKTEEVEEGSGATAPTSPSRDGYRFIGWDINFSNVVSNLTVTAQYKAVYIVTFVDYDGSILKTEEVLEGNAATAPEVNRYGYVFTGWSIDFSNVVSNITTTAQYEIADILKVKENDDWTNIKKVFRRVNGNWVEQGNKTWDSLFSNNYKYNVGQINPIAILYEDGTLVFQDNNTLDTSHGAVVETYTDWLTERYYKSTLPPWMSHNITSVECNSIASPAAGSCWFYYETDTTEQPITSITINSLDTTHMDYTDHMFYNCPNITSLNVSDFNTSNIKSMTAMFSRCSNLTSLDVSNFDTSNVIDFPWMFEKCSAITELDVSNWDTSSAVNMGAMFNDCTNLKTLDVSNWNTSNATNMADLFNRCSSLISLNVSNWNTSNVTSMGYMFNLCSALTELDVSNFDTHNVTSMALMFNGCSNLTSLDVSDFDTSNVTKMNDMFCYCSNLTELNMNNWDTNNVTTMRSMFNSCSNLQSVDISNLVATNLTDMGWMFYNCSNLTSIDLAGFSTNKVTDMGTTFRNCTNLEFVNLCNFDMSTVTITDIMFIGCSNSNLTIYVKDEAAKAKIESSTNFPSTATVVISVSGGGGGSNNPTFTVVHNGQNYTYEFENGMSFEQFVNSSYNDGSFSIGTANVLWNISNATVPNAVMFNSAALCTSVFDPAVLTLDIMVINSDEASVDNRMIVADKTYYCAATW